MSLPITDRKSVEEAVAALQDRLADGDPEDALLRAHCESELTALRAAYRKNPAAFTPETVEALREFKELLSSL